VKSENPHPQDQSTPPHSAWLIATAVCGFLAVALGAFGAHGLKDIIAANDGRDWWQTATLYHLAHAAAMTAAVAMRRHLAAGLMLCGVLIFSGTLYAMALGAPRWFGAVTPLGGLCLLAGWLFLLRRPRD